MRESVAAFAVITRSGPAWLVQWNPSWQRLNLVGGHKRPTESFRECCVREAAEELGLIPDRDFAVAPMPLARVEYDAWSASKNADTHYTFELFRVELLRPEVLAVVTARPENCWVTAAEVAAGLAADGTPVSETVLRVLTAAGLLTPP